MRAVLIWIGLVVAMTAPLGVAAMSPLTAWRDPIYIMACLAAVAGMALLLLQPLLAGGRLPGLTPLSRRRLHAAVGVALTALAAMHVAGLWVTSPPDVVDVLLFRSPTPFSVWAVVSMWALVAAALLAAFRRRLRLTPTVWRLAHAAAASLVVVGAVVHAMLIEGMMGWASKAALRALALAATAKVMADLQPWIHLSAATRSSPPNFRLKSLALGVVFGEIGTSLWSAFRRGNPDESRLCDCHAAFGRIRAWRAGGAFAAKSRGADCSKPACAFRRRLGR